MSALRKWIRQERAALYASAVPHYMHSAERYVWMLPNGECYDRNFRRITGPEVEEFRRNQIRAVEMDAELVRLMFSGSAP